MVGGQETIFHWARVLQLTMVVDSVVVLLFLSDFTFWILKKNVVEV